MCVCVHMCIHNIYIYMCVCVYMHTVNRLNAIFFNHVDFSENRLPPKRHGFSWSSHFSAHVATNLWLLKQKSTIAVHWGLWPTHMGLSENRVYSQWNSHLIGIMIINHWVQWGTRHFQTNPHDWGMLRFSPHFEASTQRPSSDPGMPQPRSKAKASSNTKHLHRWNCRMRDVHHVTASMNSLV